MQPCRRNAPVPFASPGRSARTAASWLQRALGQHQRPPWAQAAALRALRRRLSAVCSKLLAALTTEGLQRRCVGTRARKSLNAFKQVWDLQMAKNSQINLLLPIDSSCRCRSFCVGSCRVQAAACSVTVVLLLKHLRRGTPAELKCMSCTAVTTTTVSEPQGHAERRGVAPAVHEWVDPRTLSEGHRLCDLITTDCMLDL